MSNVVDVVIVGAGPYGLSLAAHLQAHGISNRIFGPPMDVWRNHMPAGMLLKSDGFASNLSDPKMTYPLEKYCAEQGIAYDHETIPVAIETFIGYAIAFQQKLVSHLDTRSVTRIERDGENFRVQLQDGETVLARRVVLAVGISYFAYRPPELESLPLEMVSHSSQHPNPAALRGKKVTVLGSGASAVDLAVLMHESGVDVTILARAKKIRFHDMPPAGGRTLLQKLRHPTSGLGPGWKSRFYTDLPGVFRYFSPEKRLSIIRRHLGPAPGWPMKARVMGKVPLLLDHKIARAETSNGQLFLSLTNGNGATEQHETDHLVAATGYRPDIRRLPFLDGLRNEIRTLEHAPVLSPEFQSSVPGLYFIGIAAVNDFGPMMRFAYGSDYTARKLARHLCGKSRS